MDQAPSPSWQDALNFRESETKLHPAVEACRQLKHNTKTQQKLADVFRFRTKLTVHNSTNIHPTLHTSHG